MLGRSRVWLPLCVAVAAGCATSSAPRGFLRPPLEAQRSAYGGWIEVTLVRESHARTSDTLSGELIAVGDDSIFVLGAAGLRALAVPRIARARLMAYDAQYGALASWTLLGVLSTASHGLGLILSAPVWILAGTGATSSQSRAPLHEVTQPGNLPSLRPFARFPQGLPPGLDRRTLFLR
jgi:hypothetical protein